MSVSNAKEYAEERLPAFGWSVNEFDSLEKLWEKESNWNYKAQNQSGAVGIPQLKGGKNVPNFMTDYRVQIEHGLAYIKNRYGTPTAAWNFHKKNGWY